jgi:transcriptional regulator with XRE-family HTH domain
MTEDSKSKKPNTLLRFHRESQGWSQRELAEQIDADPTLVSRWESGERGTSPYYQQKLIELFGKDAIELGFIEPLEKSSPGPYNPIQNDMLTLTPESDEDMNRRQTLQILGTGTALLIGIPPNDLLTQEIENLFTRKIARLQTWIIEGLEDATRLRWQLYYTSRNTLTEDGLLNQIMKLELLADDGGKNHPRICQMLAQNYQLAGSLARDQFRYHEAERYFREAYDIAAETNLPDLSATALARHGLVFLRQEQVDKALKLYQQAGDVAKHAQPYTRAYVLSGLAEAEARNSHALECYRLLDQAEQLLDRVQTVPFEEDFAYVQLTMQSLQDSRGECFVLLGEPLKGLDYLHAAESQLDQKMSRNHCRLLMQQAEAFLAANQPDQCVQQALKGLHIARQLESKSNINWSREIYVKLQQSKWKNEPVVEELRAAISQT